MIYHLYFKSGERAYNMKLYDKREDETTCENQLLANSQGGVELIKLEYRDLKLVSYQSTSCDKKVHIKSCSVTDRQLDIYLSEGIGKAEDFPEASQFRFVKEDKYLEIYNQGSEDAEQFTILFHYEEGENHYTGKFLVDCIPDDDIYEAVLDFGSEASQLLINRENPPQYSELFNECARHFYDLQPEQIEDRTFDQQEETDNELFRSVYFLPKQEKGKKDISQSVIDKPGKDDPLLGFITKRDDSEKGQRLANIKISYLSGERPGDVDLEKLHQGIVMRFIHEIVLEVEEKKEQKQGKCGIRLYLLVPNVMGQGQLSDFINAIRRYTSLQEFRQLLPEGMKDVVFDIHSYSESDASFVSWLTDENNNVEPGNYLIIDVGKGTTDFSIVKVEDGRNAVSIYRSGFVGAGNALTYAIFVNYIVKMAGTLEAPGIIKKVLSEAKESELYDLENILENYKKNATPVINNKETTIEEKQNVDTIIDRIRQRGDIGDDFHIIESTIHHIIKKIVLNVKETRFRKVILSGRAFKYQPFQTATKDILEKFYHMEGEVITLEDRQLKKGCLTGPLESVQINKQSDMIGIPIAVDVTKRRGEKAKLEERFKEILSETASNRSPVLKEKWQERWLKRPLQEFLSWLKTSFTNNIGESTHQEKRGSQTVNMDADNDDIRSILRGELKVGHCNENTHFYVSDDEYETINDQSLDEHSSYQLFFDGNDFFVKDKSSSIRLKPCVEMLSNDMLYESLFPYPYRILDKNCNIPEIDSNL